MYTFFSFLCIEFLQLFKHLVHIKLCRQWVPISSNSLWKVTVVKLCPSHVSSKVNGCKENTSSHLIKVHRMSSLFIPPVLSTPVKVYQLAVSLLSKGNLVAPLCTIWANVDCLLKIGLCWHIPNVGAQISNGNFKNISIQA